MRQNIVITGASSGLGWEMARQFAAMGRNLALCARRTERLEALQQELKTSYPDIQVHVRALDVNDHEQVFAVFEAFAQDFGGRIDRVIVNAGMGKGASLGTGHFEANRQTAETNFVAALAQCEAALTQFRAQNHGHLVTISSVSAVRGFRRAMTVYAATKAALTSLSEGIRVDLLNTPIKVTTVHPGYIQSEINDRVDKVPFMVDTETGCRAIIKAIEKEGDNAFVPGWPWAWMRWVLRWAPLRMLRSLG
ncbi:Short-chain dehydrogenase [Ferrimonas marina]|uniref:Short-chain dehydrogenase n=1 Tax=Ferrimonas marina TaxID=299255 RepID=A0A1M5X3U8_9GAMM|nr:Short-chain dehydrogenase [Ferrimonas marina]